MFGFHQVSGASKTSGMQGLGLGSGCVSGLGRSQAPTTWQDYLVYLDTSSSFSRSQLGAATPATFLQLPAGT